MSNFVEKMEKSNETLKRQFISIRTGRANADMLSRITVDYYGSIVPLKQVASITVPESMTLQLNVFDKNSIKSVEKAILTSDLNVSPQTDGATIRIRLPELSEERRKELVKSVKKLAEDSKVILRNIRRDHIDELKKQEKDKKISEDESKREQEHTQKEIDKCIGIIDQVAKEKEADILKV